MERSVVPGHPQRNRTANPVCASARGWVQQKLEVREPDAIHARDVLEYVNHLRGERENGHAAVSRTVTILKCFYRAMVAIELNMGSSYTRLALCNNWAGMQ